MANRKCIRLSEKFLSLYEEVIDALRFLFYIILSNCVRSTLFRWDKHRDISRPWFHVCTKVHCCKNHVCERKTLSGQPNTNCLVFLFHSLARNSALLHNHPLSNVYLGRDVTRRSAHVPTSSEESFDYAESRGNREFHRELLCRVLQSSVFFAIAPLLLGTLMARSLVTSNGHVHRKNSLNGR